MGIAHEHEIHRRRLGRNIGLGAVLGGLVAIIFVLTFIKVTVLDPTLDDGTRPVAEAKQ